MKEINGGESPVKVVEAELEISHGAWYIFLRFFNLLHKLKTILIYSPFFGRIGRGSVIRNPVLISNPQFIRIGERTYMRDGLRLEVVKLKGRIPELLIGNDVLIEQNCHIACCNRIIIEDNVAIAARCSIVDIRHPHPSKTDGKNIGSSILLTNDTVRIGKGAFLGVGVTVLPGVTIGAGAVIGAHSVVTRDIPANSLAIGCPAITLNSAKRSS